MASVNKVIIVGNLGKDPEVRTFPSGGQIAQVSIATTDRWKDKQTGEQKEATEWHRVVFRDRLAEVAGQYLRKGSQVYIEGSIRTRKYNDKDGVEKYVTEINAFEMKMLGSRPDDGGNQGDGGYGNQAPQRQQPQRQQQGRGQQQRQAPARSQGPSGFDDMDDDIPF